MIARIELHAVLSQLRFGEPEPLTTQNPIVQSAAEALDMEIV